MSDEDKKSVFNAGVAQTERIDNLQMAINAARFNPLARNEEVGKFNYEIMISSCDSLFNEAWGKLTPTERDEGKRTQTVIYEYLKLNPIIVYSNNQIRINKQNYEKFTEIVKMYERLIKDFLEKHDLNNPSKDEDDDEL